MIVQQGMNNTKGTAPPPPCLHWQVSLTWTILGCERELEMAASMMAILSRCKPLGRAGGAGGIVISGAQVAVLLSIYIGNHHVQKGAHPRTFSEEPMCRGRYISLIATTEPRHSPLNALPNSPSPSSS